jgi:hypothetical protein
MYLYPEAWQFARGQLIYRLHAVFVFYPLPLQRVPESVFAATFQVILMIPFLSPSYSLRYLRLIVAGRFILPVFKENHHSFGHHVK